MKKTTVLLLLSGIPSVIHTMETKRHISTPQTKKVTKTATLLDINKDVLDRIKKDIEPDNEIIKISVSPDGAKVAVLDNDDDVTLYDANTGKPINMISVSHPYPREFSRKNRPIKSLEFNEEGTEISVSDDYTTRKYSVVR
ncbi:hypothetical protein H0X06_01185 [Candidatus Dependentiae bacterium]|nr:hypothetical protein [Candidatus Dependentiae bacterium]